MQRVLQNINLVALVRLLQRLLYKCTVCKDTFSCGQSYHRFFTFSQLLSSCWRPLILMMHINSVLPQQRSKMHSQCKYTNVMGPWPPFTSCFKYQTLTDMMPCTKVQKKVSVTVKDVVTFLALVNINFWSF